LDCFHCFVFTDFLLNYSECARKYARGFSRIRSPKVRIEIFDFYRAIGLPKKFILRVSLYESMAILFGALILGTIIGVLSSSLIAILFMTIVELPFTLIVKLLLLSHINFDRSPSQVSC
jgi:hypothetical protein